MKTFRGLAARVAASLFICPFAHAATWVEAGEAGQSLAAANRVTVAAPSQIVGNIARPTDADLFAIRLTGGVPFSASSAAFGAASAVLDTQLFLFDSAGLGLRYNDDRTVIDPYSRLDFTPLVSGRYYLGVSAVGFNPVDAGGNFIYVRDAFDPSAVRGPSAFGALASWAADASGVTDNGDYQVNVSGASAVPEPSGAVLIALGLGGLGLARRFAARPGTDR